MTTTSDTQPPARGVIDHVILGARDLASGRAWLEERLGVPTVDGGRHEMYGTHNALLGLGPDTYFEILAVDPSVPNPNDIYPLGLSDPDVIARLAHEPCLLGWFLRVDRYDEPGVREWQRGPHRWRARFAAEPRPRAGLAPYRIQWITPCPATLLPDCGVRLTALRLHTIQVESLAREIDALCADARVTVEADDADRLVATLHGPRGTLTLT